MLKIAIGLSAVGVSLCLVGTSGAPAPQVAGSGGSAYRSTHCGSAYCCSSAVAWPHFLISRAAAGAGAAAGVAMAVVAAEAAEGVFTAVGEEDFTAVAAAASTLRRRHVEMEDHFIPDHTGRDPPGIADHEGHTDRGLVHQALSIMRHSPRK